MILSLISIAASFSSPRKNLLALAYGIFYGPYIEEGLFRKIIHLSVEYHCETLDRVLNFHHHPGYAGKLLGHEERLGKETLNLPGPVHGQFVLIRQLIHAEYGYDILKFGILLEYLLHPLRHVIVPAAHDIGIQDARSGLERIHCRIYAESGYLPAEHGGRIKMRERGRRSRVRKVIRRDIYRLD